MTTGQTTVNRITVYAETYDHPQCNQLQQHFLQAMMIIRSQIVLTESFQRNFYYNTECNNHTLVNDGLLLVGITPKHHMQALRLKFHAYASIRLNTVEALVYLALI